MHYKLLALLTLGGYAAAQQSNNTQTLNETLSQNPQLSNLTAFLNLNPQLVQQLSSAQNITILAPSDNAFAELTNSSAGALATNPSLVNALLQYHVLTGTYTASQISNTNAFIQTLLNNGTYSNVNGGQVVEAVKIGNETVFYSGLLQNVTVTQADVNFTGGILHIVDRVLTLPLNVLDTASATNLTSFRGAVNATDFIETANNTPDLTIFAPTNEAFQSISSALDNLSNSDLANVLAYHVVNGSAPLYSTDLKNGSSVQTVNGNSLTITIDEDGTVFVNAAEVVTPNVLVANGVIHIIDNVLNPSNTTGPQPSATEGAPGFTGTPGTEVPFTSGQPTPTTEINPSSEGPGPASTASGVSSSSTGVAVPMRTGAVGYSALLGAGAAVLVGY